MTKFYSRGSTIRRSPFSQAEVCFISTKKKMPRKSQPQQVSKNNRDMRQFWSAWGIRNLRKLLLDAAGYGDSYSDVKRELRFDLRREQGLVLADCLRKVASSRAHWPESMRKQLRKALFDDSHDGRHAAKHYRLLVELLAFSGLDVIWDHKNAHK